MDFIGIGAQKSGTSWAHACLYEHPEICSPVKEIHFFSRDRYAKGIAWFESQYQNCPLNAKKGEWSTSYLYSDVAAERIRAAYPHVKLLAILRNPLDRGYSQYRNAIRGGEIPKTMSFGTYAKENESVWKQGLYAEQLERYLTRFPREQLSISIYEDSKKDPEAFMRSIYTFLEIDPTFVSSMVHSEVNVARTPKKIWVERAMHHVAEFLRRHGFDTIVHQVRKSGLTDTIRHINTEPSSDALSMTADERELYAPYFAADVEKLSRIVGRDMRKEWNI